MDVLQQPQKLSLNFFFDVGGDWGRLPMICRLGVGVEKDIGDEALGFVPSSVGLVKYVTSPLVLGLSSNVFNVGVLSADSE